MCEWPWKSQRRERLILRQVLKPCPTRDAGDWRGCKLGSEHMATVVGRAKYCGKPFLAECNADVN